MDNLTQFFRKLRCPILKVKRLALLLLMGSMSLQFRFWMIRKKRFKTKPFLKKKKGAFDVHHSQHHCKRIFHDTCMHVCSFQMWFVTETEHVHSFFQLGTCCKMYICYMYDVQHSTFKNHLSNLKCTFKYYIHILYVTNW